MALSPTTTALCNSLDQKFSPLVRPAQDSKSGFKSQMRNFLSQLEGASYSAHSLINSTLATLRNDVDGIVPKDSMAAMRDIRDFINNCTFLGDANPAGVLYGSLNGIFDKIDSFIGGTGVSEFNLGSLADRMNGLLSGNKISNDLIRANQLLDCISGLCPGYNIIPKLNIVNDLFSQYKLITNPLNPDYGSIDYNIVYTAASLTSSQKDGMNIAVNGITSIKQNALTSVNSSVTKVKSLMKIGGFF